jgi:glycosyltransferase involved in cell wall biosynthesis
LTVRVLHVVEAIEAGVARHVKDVVTHVPADHEVLVPPERVGGFTDVAALEAMEAAGARVHLTPMRRSAVDPRNGAAVGRVRRLIRRSQPDLVHGHASIGGAAARLAAAGTGVARVYTPNGLIPGRAVYAVERLLGRWTDRFVAVSDTEADLVERLRIVPRERVAVIPNGIELTPPGPPTVDLRAQLRLRDDTPLVGSVGRLAAQKAPEVFVRACARIASAQPDAHFVLVGDGPLRDVVNSEVEATGLEGRFVHLPGLHGAATVMDQFDVFVLASRYEGGPYAPLEAMRAGTPVVLTDVVGNRDTVTDGESGLVVAPDDPDALAGAVSRLLTDHCLRERLAAAGRERVAAHFDVRLMADRLAVLYRSLVTAA